MLKLFFENIMRRLVRVLKLYRRLILTKKVYMKPPKIRNPPPWPPGGIFRFKKESKVALGLRNFGYEFIGVWGDV